VKATLTAPGRLAQLGERLPYKQEVGGSIPSPPIADSLSASATFDLATVCAFAYRDDADYASVVVVASPFCRFDWKLRTSTDTPRSWAEPIAE
jgi:hypothetical protein